MSKTSPSYTTHCRSRNIYSRLADLMKLFVWPDRIKEKMIKSHAFQGSLLLGISWSLDHLQHTYIIATPWNQPLYSHCPLRQWSQTWGPRTTSGPRRCAWWSASKGIFLLWCISLGIVRLSTLSIHKMEWLVTRFGGTTSKEHQWHIAQSGQPPWIKN